MRASYTAYFIAYFVVTMGATWLLSAPRYLAAMLSLPAAMSALAENARTERVLILLSVLMFSCISSFSCSDGRYGKK